MQPVAQLIKAYLAAGGAKMDEASFQKYKYAMLLNWLIQERSFKTVTLQDNAGKYYERQIAQPDNLVCKSATDCGFITTDINQAVDHLVTHFPKLFVDQSQKKQGTQGVQGATNGPQK